MIIVVEGRDGTGKTTLARGLASRYRLGYFKTTDGPCHNDEVDDWLVLNLLRAIGPLERPLVIDRSIISGVAYSNAYDNHADAARTAYKWFHRLVVAGHEVRLIHLYAERHVRYARDAGAHDADLEMIWDLDLIADDVGGVMPDGHRWRYGTSGVDENTLLELVARDMELRNENDSNIAPGPGARIYAPRAGGGGAV